VHEMGKIIPIGDAHALADAALEILSHPQNYVRAARPIAERYQPDTIAAAYEKLFDELKRAL
jgi:glycosyltransferase involved in cell wall biosynthesis